MFDGCHFSVSFQDDIVVLTDKEAYEQNEKSIYIPYIKNIVELLESRSFYLFPKFYSFTDTTMVIEKMNPIIQIEEHEFDNFINQAIFIAKTLSYIKVHHNDLKPQNFVWKYVNGVKKYYVIDFNMTQIFDTSFNYSSIPPILLDKEFLNDMGYLSEYHPRYNEYQLLNWLNLNKQYQYFLSNNLYASQELDKLTNIFYYSGEGLSVISS